MICPFHHPGRQPEKATQLEGHTAPAPAGPSWKPAGMRFPAQVWIISSDGYFSISPGVLLICLPLLSLQQFFRQCCKTHSPRQSSFVQIQLRDGIASNLLGNAQLSILHPGRLFLMSLSDGPKTSYFEIPLLLYPRSGINLWAHSFLFLLVIKPLLACRFLEWETKTKTSS